MKFTEVPSLQPQLEKEIRELRDFFAGLPLGAEIARVDLIGSCSEGRATYRSDIDLLVVLKEGPLNFERVSRLKADLEEKLGQAGLGKVLPIQMTLVLSAVDGTQEPAMRQALKAAQKIYPEGHAA